MSMRKTKFQGARDAAALMLAWMRDDDEAQLLLTSSYQGDATPLVAGLLNISCTLAQLRCRQIDESPEEYLEQLALSFAEVAEAPE